MAESIAQLAGRLDAELAERLPEIRRLADAYVALTGEQAPTLVGLLAAPATSSAPSELPPPAVARRPSAQLSPDERAEAILAALREAAEHGDGWVLPRDLYEAVGGRLEQHRRDVKQLLAAGRIEDNGKGTVARRLRIAQMRAEDPPADPPPVVEEPLERPTRGSSPAGEVDLTRLFPEDEPRQRIARAALKACESDMRHPAAVASECVLNRPETAYVMRELARAGALVEVDGKYGRAA